MLYFYIKKKNTDYINLCKFSSGSEISLCSERKAVTYFGSNTKVDSKGGCKVGSRGVKVTHSMTHSGCIPLHGDDAMTISSMVSHVSKHAMF